MAYCGPRGIPLSTFLSWSKDDQAAALAWSGYESRRCRNCGFHPDEDQRHTHTDICPGCVKRDQAAKAAEDTPGAHVRLAHGTAATCDRCQLERQVQAAAPTRG